MLHRCPALFLVVSALWAAPPSPELISRITDHADRFAEKARLAVSREMLVQRSYTLPPHSHFAVGAAADTLYARYFIHEIVSAYSIGPLKGDQSGNLVEYRELLTADDQPVQTPAAARKAMELDISAGEERIRKRILAEFT